MKNRRFQVTYWNTHGGGLSAVIIEAGTLHDAVQAACYTHGISFIQMTDVEELPEIKGEVQP